VRRATLLILMCLALPTWLGAQAAPATTGAPEVLSGTAQLKNATGAISGTFEVRLSRYSLDFDRNAVENALRLGGYPRFLPALRNAPEVGQLVLAGGEAHAIRYARERTEGGQRTIVLVTDRPVFFVGAGRADAKPRAGYEVGILQIQLDPSGRGTGTMAGAARVRPDGDGGVRLDDYAEEPISLVNVTRKPS
jgi:hypothetical protein